MLNSFFQSSFSTFKPFTLCAVLALCACSTTSDLTPVATADDQARHIALQGESNFRDLGGYQTQDGQTVKHGLLFRSGTLAELTPQDIAILEKLNIAAAYDFRTTDEQKRGGLDKLPANTKSYLFPVSAGNTDGALSTAFRSGDFNKIPPDILLRMNKDFPDYNKEFSGFLHSVIEQNGKPVVFHCTAGKDRTGWASAVILYILGVDWETIERDYLLSNTFRENANQKRIEFFRQRVAKAQQKNIEDVDAGNLSALMINTPEALAAGKAEAERRYGSMDNYISQGLKLSKQDIETLRKIYLQ